VSEQVSDPPAELTDPRPGPRRSGAGALADVLVVLGAFLVLGLLAGVAWWLLVDPAYFTKLAAGGSMGEVQLGKRFGADGWYVVVAVLAGLPAGAALTWWRSRDYLLTSALVVAGSLLAAAASAGTGFLLGPGNPDVALVAATRGAHVPVQLAVAAQLRVAGVPLSSVYLAWPISVLAGALLVLWSKPLEPEL
jgi:hypothetical protein